MSYAIYIYKTGNCEGDVIYWKPQFWRPCFFSGQHETIISSIILRCSITMFSSHASCWGKCGHSGYALLFCFSDSLIWLVAHFSNHFQIIQVLHNRNERRLSKVYCWRSQVQQRARPWPKERYRFEVLKWLRLRGWHIRSWPIKTEIWNLCNLSAVIEWTLSWFSYKNFPSLLFSTSFLTARTLHGTFHHF